MTHHSSATSAFARGLALGATLFAGALLAPLASAADEGYVIETINRGSGIMSEGPTEERTLTYVAHDKMKVVNEGPEATNMVLDPASGVMSFVNDTKKEYFQINVQDVIDAMKDPRMAEMRSMIGDIEVSVTDTGETKRIGDWDCRRYQVTKRGMMEVDQEVWATESVDLDVSRFTRMMSMAGAQDLPGSEAQQAEMAKIKGYPVLTLTRMMMMGTEMKTEIEVQSIRREAIPAAFFEIPADYSLKEIGSGMMGHGAMPEAPPAQ
ncbi:MAG: DUF4412 domain-containing protein [Chromatiaceae bacterium]|nr:DUF4412 domain-containing protein [Chromatiaceae bacterium]